MQPKYLVISPADCTVNTFLELVSDISHIAGLHFLFS